MPFPETLNAHPKIIFFTDFDGTITLKDSNCNSTTSPSSWLIHWPANDFMTDNYGFGYEKRRQGNKEVLNGLPFRDGFQQMLDSWTISFP
jgi:2-hydroxy-3-keto-5-methylthiopentenyl-1-phosphate phosphatase